MIKISIKVSVWITMLIAVAVTAYSFLAIFGVGGLKFTWNPIFDGLLIGALYILAIGLCEYRKGIERLLVRHVPRKRRKFSDIAKQRATQIDRLEKRLSGLYERVDMYGRTWFELTVDESFVGKLKRIRRKRILNAWGQEPIDHDLREAIRSADPNGEWIELPDGWVSYTTPKNAPAAVQKILKIASILDLLAPRVAWKAKDRYGSFEVPWTTTKDLQEEEQEALAYQILTALDELRRFCERDEKSEASKLHPESWITASGDLVPDQKLPADKQGIAIQRYVDMFNCARRLAPRSRWALWQGGEIPNCGNLSEALNWASKVWQEMLRLDPYGPWSIDSTAPGFPFYPDQSLVPPTVRRYLLSIGAPLEADELVETESGDCLLVAQDTSGGIDARDDAPLSYGAVNSNR